MLCANLIIQFFFASDEYNQNPVECLLKENMCLFSAVSDELGNAFMEFYEENSMAWNCSNHWTEEVQRAFTIHPSSKGGVEKRRIGPTPAFNVLCQKASKWIQYLPEILKLENQLDKLYDFMIECKWGHGDEYEKQEKEQMQTEKPLLLEKAERMIKIMMDIAVDIGNPRISEIIQGLHYDIEKRPISRSRGGSRFYVENGKHLSDTQLKLSTFAFNLAHLSPEELSMNSQNC